MTRAQHVVLQAVHAWFDTHDYAPSLEELASALGKKSPSNVHQHVKALIAQGKLKQGTSEKRNIELPAPPKVSTGTAVGRAVQRMVAAVRAYDDRESDGPSITDQPLRALIAAARELAQHVAPRP